MKKCYTISGLKNIPSDFDVVQFTENSRIWPSQRQSASHIQALRQEGNKSKIIVHQDFVYIASRWCMFSKATRQAILTQLSSYNSVDIVGIVMHTDYPLKKEVLKAKEPAKAIVDSYTAGIWDKQSIVDHFNSNSLLEDSLVMLAHDLVEFGVKHKIYLENNVAIGPSGEGSFSWLLDLFHKYPYFHEVYGLVYDTCHQYSVDGTWYPADEIVSINKNIAQVIVHLNTIPEEVTPGSRRDRHSFNTIYECSLHTADYYKSYAKELDKNNILWVREIKTETIERELKQLENE